MNEMTIINRKMEDSQWEIACQLRIQNKLELLKMAREAGIVSEDEYKESILKCKEVLFGKK